MSKTEPLHGAAQLEEHKRRSHLWVMALTLFAFVVGVYLPTCRYGFVFDEMVILHRAVPPRSIGELLQRTWAPHFPGLAYFRPIPHATYLVQYMWDRNEPGYFHLFNVLLMGFTACAGFALLRLPRFGIRTMPAAIAAALFAVHPASSSSVTPVVGRETLIGACLTICAVYGFFRGGRPWYVASIILLALALLSKEQAVVIPFLFLLGDLLGLSKDAPGRRTGRWIRRYAPPLLVLSIYIFLRWTQFSGSEYNWQVFDHPFGPILSVGYALQTVFTPFEELAYEPALDVWLSYERLAVAVILLCVLIWELIRNRSVSHAGALFWFGWFLVTIAPTANVVEQQAPYSERYVLLAVFAVAALLASVVSAMPETSRSRVWTASVGLAAIAAAAAITIHRGRCFENTLTFSRQWAKTSPNFGEAQMALGVELYLFGHVDEATESFRAGLKTEPESRDICRQWLGKMLILQGRYEEADRQLRMSIDKDPGAPYPYYLSGVALAGSGDADKAVTQFQQAVELSPGFGAAHFLLADTLKSQNNALLSRRHLSVASMSPVLDLSCTRVDDSHLRTLSRFPNLRFLRLEATQIGDKGLEYLRESASLNRLWIPGTTVTSRGLVHLRGLPNLSSLVLTGTRVSDEGVAHLLSMSQLKHLDIRNTRITRRGFRKLKDGLPDCLILH